MVHSAVYKVHYDRAYGRRTEHYRTFPEAYYRIALVIVCGFDQSHSRQNEICDIEKDKDQYILAYHCSAHAVVKLSYAAFFHWCRFGCRLIKAVVLYVCVKAVIHYIYLITATTLPIISQVSTIIGSIVSFSGWRR